MARFRRAVVLVLAANRLRLLAKQNLTDRVCFFKSQLDRRFYTFSRVRSAATARNTTAADELTALRDLFSGGSDLNTITRIAEDLNRCLFESGDVPNAKEALLRCLTFIETPNERNRHELPKGSDLAPRLSQGLAKLCRKEPKLASYYSFRRRLVASLATNVIKPNLVALGDFEAVCKELEESLKREEQAQGILNAQSVQLEELSVKLAPYSTLEMQSVRLREMVGEVGRKYQRKEKLVRHLQRKVSGLQAMKESYEKSAQSILVDKKLFLGYCRSVEALVQGGLRPAIDAGVEWKQVLEIVRRISCVKFGVGHELADAGGMKLSPESLACQSIVNLLCIAFNMLIVRVYCPVGGGGGCGSAGESTDGKVEINESFESASDGNTLVSSRYSTDSISINFG